MVLIAIKGIRAVAYFFKSFLASAESLIKFPPQNELTLLLRIMLDNLPLLSFFADSSNEF